MIAAIYARFSTDRQRETSIDDQVHQATLRITAENWRPGPVFSDSSTSGSTPVAHRAGGAKLLAAAVAGEFQALILEGLDRLSRDLIEQETIVRNLEHAGIRIIGMSDGYDSSSHSRKVPRIVRGLVNEIYIDDLREKTHRGLAGQVNRGYFAGGLPYGYKSVADGQNGHHLTIDADQADVVLRIYREFASGKSPRTIALELNERCIHGPRGPQWSVTAIYGQKGKSCGILANDIYQGIYIWNRTRWVKTPGKGTRTRYDRPESEWMKRDMPELRIIPPDLWEAVQRRRSTMRQYQNHAGRRARTLFGGILRCGHCGGAVTAVDMRRYGCSRHKDRGTCRPSLKVSRDDLDQTVINYIRTDLLGSVTAKQLQKRLREAIRRREHANAPEELHKQIKQCEHTVARLVDAIARSGWSEALNERLAAAEQERNGLQAQLANRTAQTLPRIMPDIEKRFANIRDNLVDYLGQDIERARQVLHGLVGNINIVEDDGAIYAEMEINGHQILQAVAGSDVASIGGSGGALLGQKHRLLLRRIITD